MFGLIPLPGTAERNAGREIQTALEDRNGIARRHHYILTISGVEEGRIVRADRVGDSGRGGCKRGRHDCKRAAGNRAQQRQLFHGVSSG